MVSFVVLCGRSGVGKTAVRTFLASQLGAVSLGPDGTTGRWNQLYERLDAAPKAVVECVRLPRALRRKVRLRGATIVELTASPQVQEARLRGRGEPEAVVRQRLAEAGGLGYEDPVSVDISIDTDERSPEDIADELVNRLQALQPASASAGVFSVPVRSETNP